MKLFQRIKAMFSGLSGRKTQTAGQGMTTDDVDAMCRDIAAENKTLDAWPVGDERFCELAGLQVRIFRAIRAKESRLAASLMRRESILLFGHVTAAVELEIESMKSGKAILRFADILPDENTTGGVAVEE